MNKTQFLYVLQTALLSFDGVSKEVLQSVYNIPKEYISVGCNLCDYLKSKQLIVKNTKSK